MTLPLRTATTACPDENVLAGFATGALPATAAPEVEAHLDGCTDCRALVAAVAAESSVPEASVSDAPTRLDTGAPTLAEVGTEPVLPEGTRLGAYVLRERLGAGGMGVVYAADDTKLERRVALKLLRPLRDGAEEEGRARLLREAQAMARLSHPNVLPIFELGTADGRDFLAMEWVRGTTLAGWLRERERSWSEVLEVFLAAGAGLSAAHRAGLVHRDFKPANVLVGLDGRVRVTDFGLARHGTPEQAPATQGRATGEPPAPTWELTLSPAQPTLTHAGTVAGTPAYMSPEQRAGHAVDARSDQYSFCVALHEALHGERPRGPDAPALRPRARAKAPRHIHTALSRGLASAPEDRFPSMDALLAELSSPPSPHVPPVRRAAVLLLLAMGLGGLLLWRTAKQPATTPEPVQPVAEQQQDAPASNPLISLRVGEVHELSLPQLQRLAVADPSVVELRTIPGGVQLTALSSGATHVMAWLQDGERRVYVVSVTLR